MTSLQAVDLLQKPLLSFANPLEDLKLNKDIIYNVKERNQWKSHSNKVNALGVNPNLKNKSSHEIAIASGNDDGEVKLWDWQGNLKGDLKKNLPIEPDSRPIWSLKFDHRGQNLAATGYDGKVWLWNIESGHAIAFPGHGYASYDADFSHDDSLVVSSGSESLTNHTVQVWQIPKKSEDNAKLERFKLAETSAFSQPVYGVAFHPQNSNIVILGGQGSNEIRLWDYRSKQKSNIQTIGHHGSSNSGIYQVKFSPDGQYIVSASGDGMIIFWSASNITKLKQIVKVQAHEQNVFGLNFSLDGKYFVSSSGDQAIKVWDVQQLIKQGNNYKPETLKGHTSDVTRTEFLAFKDDSTAQVVIVSSSNDHTIRLWETHRSDENQNIKNYGYSLLRDFVSLQSIHLSFRDTPKKIKSLCWAEKK